MNYEDITRFFIFQLDGEQYTAQEIPSNDENGRKICRICGAVITNGITGAAMLENCFTCTPPPRYPKPSDRITYSAEESDILEARATSINYDFD